MITYGAVISACETGKQPARALELLEEMRQQGLAPYVIRPTAVSRVLAEPRACETGTSPDRALEVLVVCPMFNHRAVIRACEQGH